MATENIFSFRQIYGKKVCKCVKFGIGEENRVRAHTLEPIPFAANKL